MNEQNKNNQDQKDPNELVKVATPKVKGNDSGFKVVHRKDMLPGEVEMSQDQANQEDERKKQEEQQKRQEANLSGEKSQTLRVPKQG